MPLGIEVDSLSAIMELQVSMLFRNQIFEETTAVNQIITHLKLHPILRARVWGELGRRSLSWDQI